MERHKVTGSSLQMPLTIFYKISTVNEGGCRKKLSAFFTKLSRKSELSPPNTLMVTEKDKTKTKTKSKLKYTQNPRKQSTTHQTTTMTAPAGRMELWCRDPTPRRKKLLTNYRTPPRQQPYEHRQTTQNSGSTSVKKG